MANTAHLAILKQGTSAWNRWREEHADILPDLERANLRGAVLVQADLNRAAMSQVDLRGAYLMGANLNRADLRGANLRGADLTLAELYATTLAGADLNDCATGYTRFANVDLSAVAGLETVKHEFPSTVGIDTIYQSHGSLPEVFLRGCGVPENFITFMHSLTASAFDFYSCFISHSAQDKPFVERLHNDLQAKGVRTWYFPDDARGGRTVWGEIDRSVRLYDKLVVVCSKRSLRSEPVVREVERALQRESREHTEILFPITLDGYLFDGWEHELKADLLRKVIGDFRGAARSHVRYTKAFDKLVRDLLKA